MTQTRSELPSFDFQLWSPPHLDTVGSFSDDLIKQFDSKRSMIREEVLKDLPEENLPKPIQDHTAPPSTTDDDEEEDDDEDEHANPSLQDTRESFAEAPEEPELKEEEEREQREEREEGGDKPGKEASFIQDNHSEQVVNIDDAEEEDQKQLQQEIVRKPLPPVSTKDSTAEQQPLSPTSPTSPTCSMSPSSSLMMQSRPEAKSLLRKSSAFLRQKLFKKEEEVPPMPISGTLTNFPPKPLQYSAARPSTDAPSSPLPDKTQHRISLPSTTKPVVVSEVRRGSEPIQPPRQQQKRRSFFRHFLPK
ncbi:hypothetical protein EC973_000482 [Apophysomyces ossiformis]|uniref:Uncharacterized protein n=1 Tax=Apophysomyces ossiformis TaxID=679940 RepID=A0A8H7BJ18_9FUNG|nr:hypothetical protein EC973_000482 [Apophysomyces ossiformis]